MSPKSPLPARILIPVANPGTAEELIRLGAAMLDPRAGELSALGIVEVPEGMPLSEGATRARHARRLLQKVLDYAPHGTTIHPIVRIGRHAAEGIIEASAEQEADLIIFGWGGKAPTTTDGRNGPDGLLPDHRRGRPRVPGRHRRRQAARRDATSSASSCRSAAVRTPSSRCASPTPSPPPRRHGRRPPPRPAGHHDGRPGAGRASARDLRQAAPARAAARPSCARRPNVRNAILREAERADLVVMGASASPAATAPRPTCSGRCPRRSRARAKASVIVVKTREAIGRTDVRGRSPRGPRRWPPPTAPPRRPAPCRPASSAGSASRTSTTPSSPTCVGSSSSRRSRASRSAWSCRRSTRRRPIGPIVRKAMREMVGRVPLLDEVLVIDSASTDRTREIAEAEGARVVQHPDVLTRYGSFRGKGEALWKSLFETTGDIVVWADTDVRNWHRRMVYGTLGPLLHEPRLQYVKGYYQRPIVEDGVLKEGGGGRVTELVARPLINLFYPELSGLIQPLSGRVRRTPIAARVDPVLHRLRGRDRAPHRRRRTGRHRGSRPGRPGAPRPPEPGARGPVADVVRHPAGGHEADRGAAARRGLFAELGSTMKLPRSGKGRLSLEVIELADQERPPMIRIPEYLERQRRSGGEVIVRALDVTAYEDAIDGLAELLVDAVDHGAGVNFMAGVTVDETRAWWGTVAMASPTGPSGPVVAFDDDGRVVGSTVLLYARNPNSPHRGEIGKVIVHPSARRRGLGRLLMEAAEARSLGGRSLAPDPGHRHRIGRRRDLPVARLARGGRRPGLRPDAGWDPDPDDVLLEGPPRGG